MVSLSMLPAWWRRKRPTCPRQLLTCWEPVKTVAPVTVAAATHSRAWAGSLCPLDPGQRAPLPWMACLCSGWPLSGRVLGHPGWEQGSGESRLRGALGTSLQSRQAGVSRAHGPDVSWAFLSPRLWACWAQDLITVPPVRPSPCCWGAGLSDMY